MVTIDGPAGAGKSTVSRRVAEALGYAFLDTGAIYRSLALVAQRDGVSWDDPDVLAELAATLPVRFGDAHSVHLGDDDITEAIRTQDIAEGASRVSVHGKVRHALLGLQRKLAAQGGVVAEGRDTGTVVFPDARAKFFLTASTEVRARRRFDELRARGEDASFDQIAQEVEARDQRDSQREVAPLRQAPDAILIDSGSLTEDQVVKMLVDVVRKREASPPSVRTG